MEYNSLREMMLAELKENWPEKTEEECIKMVEHNFRSIRNTLENRVPVCSKISF